MTNTTPLKGYIAGSAFVLAVLAAFVTFQVTDSSISAVQQQLSAAQTSLDEDQVAIRQIPELERKQREYRDQVGHVAIGKSTIPDLLQYLQSISAMHTVAITNITFSAPAALRVGSAPGVQQAPALSQPSTVSASTVVSPAAPPATSFIQQPVTFTMSGQYRNLLYALADLSTGPSLVRIDTEPNLQQGDNHTVKMDVKATLLEVPDAFRTIAASAKPPAAPARRLPSRASKKVAKKGAPSRPVQPIGQRRMAKSGSVTHG